MPRVPLDCSLPAARVLLALRDQPWPFALTGRWAGGGAIVGCAPAALLGSRDPIDALDELPPAAGDAVVGGGWFGWLGYGLGARVEALPPGPPRPVPMPDAHLAFYDHVLRRDADGRWWFESLGEPGTRLDELRRLLAAAPEVTPPPRAEFTLRAPGAGGHEAAVLDCVKRIAAGEIFQANLCLRLEAAWEGDVAALFAAAASALAPAYGACFVTPWGGIASLSPELFLRREGRAPGRGDADLLRATFPPGSVTGDPKVQAMKVIAALEATGREVYSGAIGYASPHAGLELSVAIRTFEARGGRLWLGSGGGVVADSDPRGELEECLVKARPLIAAIGGRLAPGAVAPAAGTGVAGVLPPGVAPGRARSPLPPSALAGGRRRPDPALGVFETLLVAGGEPQRLGAHLARLARSLDTVYGLPLPVGLEARVRALATGDRMRLRIDVVPGADATLALAPARTRELPIVLHPYTLPGGLGAHKWRDRALVDALTPTPLLLDADGTVLEAGWANVLIRRDGVLLRPRADGRILPGTSLPPAAEADLTLADLLAADAILVSSSIAGTVPAVLAATSPARLDGVPRTRVRSGG